MNKEEILEIVLLSIVKTIPDPNLVEELTMTIVNALYEEEEAESLECTNLIIWEVIQACFSQLVENEFYNMLLILKTKSHE